MTKRIKRWDDIPGFPNYEIGDDTYIRNKKTGRILKSSDNNSGYLTVNLYNDGHRTTKGIHRIVAESFIDGQKEGLEVNHLDGNKHNNHRNNLEWVKHRENEIHAYKHGLKHGPNRKIVKIKETGEVFESINECARAIRGDDSNIGRCLLGKQSSYLGLTFEYAEDSLDVIRCGEVSKSHEYVMRKPRTRPVRIIETGEEFNSINECAKAVNGDIPGILGCIKGRHKTHRGYHYEYIE